MRPTTSTPEPVGTRPADSTPEPVGTRPADSTPEPVGMRLRVGPWRPVAMRRTGIPQALALLSLAIGCLVDALLATGADPETRRVRRRTRMAERATRTLGRLKGAYAKLGQFAAVRLDLLPEEATDALASLRDRVPPLPARRIHRAIERELGAPLESHFARFDDDPIGAASIAQVHAASLHDGREVAVKVQYPWLEGALTADLALVRMLIRALIWWGGRERREADVLFEEFRAGLRDELDFEREARSAAEIASNLADQDRVVVPEVVASHSGRRVLTMRRHDAIPLTQPQNLHAEGVPADAVLRTLARAYATQVFLDGHFHADPHPGNLFVLRDEEMHEAPRVLFVDFGLSRRLDADLRRELRQGLFAVMQRDAGALLAAMCRMDMIAPGAEAGVRLAVEAMFERIAAGGGALALRGDQVLSLKDEAKTLLQDTPGLRLPLDLLLYAKTLSYLFALGRDLDPDVDMMKLSLPYALRFLAEERMGAEGTRAASVADPAAG